MVNHKHQIPWTTGQMKVLADCVKQFDKSNVGIKKRNWKKITAMFTGITGIKRSASSLRNKSFVLCKQSSPKYRSKKQGKPLRKDARKRLDEIGDQTTNALDDMMLELGLASFDVDELGAASENMNEDEFDDFIANVLVDGGGADA